MKFQKAFIVLLLLIIPFSLVQAEGRGASNGTQKIERSLAVDSSVIVSLCVNSGDVTVRGWNKNEILAKSSEVGSIELKRTPESNQTGAASKVVVWLADKADEPGGRSGCQAYGGVQLMVPRGASVYLQTGDGTIDVGDVSSAYARTETGEISISKVSRSVEAISFSGAISVENSTGRMSMKTVSGSIHAANLRPNDENDCFEATTISGDLELEHVAHQAVTVKTTNGAVGFSGPLARQGNYTFNTTSSDVTLSMPKDASFRLNARISRDREVTTDFPLTLTIEDQPPMPAKKAVPPQPPEPAPEREPKHPMVVMVDPQDKTIKVKPVVVRSYYSLRRIKAVCGSGDALITVTSFSGTIHLEDSGN